MIASAPPGPAPSPIAAGASALRPPLLTDGQRFASLQIDDSHVRILDTATGRSVEVTVPAGCPMSAMGFGQVVLACGPALIDAASASVHPVPGAVTGGGTGGSDEFDAIGAQWVQGTGAAADGTPGNAFVNWHTGERRVITGHRNVFDLSGPGPPNLDDPSLSDSRRCSLQWIYASAGALQVISGLHGQLLLQRCGQSSRTGVTLDRCSPTACDSVSLTPGWATWSRGASAYAYSPRTRRRLSWTFAGFRAPEYGDGVSVAQTGGHLLFAVPQAAPPGGADVRFYAAPLPAG